MRHQTFLLRTLLLLTAGSFCATPSVAATRCEDLVQLSLGTTAVISSQVVAAGQFRPGNANGRGAAAQQQAFAKLPAFCRVMLTSKPASDSDIRIEVWLPEAGWNGRFQAVGEGGLAGSIPVALMAPALAEGYATSGTDTGHVGGNADFMPGHPEKLIDFAYRSTHEMAVAGKAIIAAFYGTAPTRSYYNACSGGGRHALTSAQRYPDDFQGIVAGAASWNQARLDAGRIGINLTVNRTSESRIPESKYPMIHAAVLQACDGTDGVRDGVIENPRACKFDYATLACKAADGPSCLTAPQVESAKVLTSPFLDEATGRVLLAAHLWPGTELQWGTLGGPEPLASWLARVRNFHLKDPAWEFRLGNIAADIERAARMDNGLLASDDFNLKPFFDRGGKLIMWHGWSDPQVPAENSIMFFNSVLKTVGAQANDSISLLLLPGVLHCGGGPGPDTFDRMAAISKWVEQGQKPARIVASHLTDGKVDRTRLLCPFGQVAKYAGLGDTNDATNFSCVPEPTVATGR
jgi:feruloyl esterase